MIKAREYVLLVFVCFEGICALESVLGIGRVQLVLSVTIKLPFSGMSKLTRLSSHTTGILQVCYQTQALQ